MSDNAIILAGEYRKIQSKTIATGQTIYPGMLVKQNSDGEIEVHGTSGGYAEKWIALEDALQGETKSDVYTADTVLDSAIMLPGSEAQVLVVAGEDIAEGDLLMSNGAGKFAETTGTNISLCVATEDCDLSGSGAVDTLCNVRFL